MAITSVAFPGSMVSVNCRASLSSSHLGNAGKRLSLSRPIFPSYMLEPETNHPAHLTFSVPTDVQTHQRRCRNINLLSIDYAFRPCLRSRLTRGGKSWPRKPWAYGERVSHTFYRYSCQHLLLKSLHGVLSIPLRSYLQCSPTTSDEQKSAASVPDLSPGKSSARIRWTSELLRFL